MIWMIMSFFKTHGSMVEQYSYEDLKNVPWLGDARIFDSRANYRLIKSAILDQLPEERPRSKSSMRRSRLGKTYRSTLGSLIDMMRVIHDVPSNTWSKVWSA